jgi:hypothetical protein
MLTHCVRFAHFRQSPTLLHSYALTLLLGISYISYTPTIYIYIPIYDVVVAQGKVGPNALLAKHGGSSSFGQSEYLVYKESQSTIRYVVRMRFA